ncbi:MAG: hypothetical protein D6737_12020 [Chloroflexi bacterium]|nr:MAG: hypothetical protein D6737_12020 [Chloroflexota bacterium]
MFGLNNGHRSPVRRNNAERYVFLMLISFAVSVVGTRLFLSLTGFPQIATGELHIAHVLWGGLFLFIAMMLQLIFINRWAHTVSAIIGGIGVGQFIDEVGKFITQSNDYFYPAAAPIIYAFFLIGVLIYLQTRSRQNRKPRGEFYRAIEGLLEVLDQDLEPKEAAVIEERLHYVLANTRRADYAKLASHLLEFIQRDHVRLHPDQTSLFTRTNKWLMNFELRFGTRRRLKTVIMIGLVVLGVLQLTDLYLSILALVSPTALESLTHNLINTQAQVNGANNVQWFLVRMTLEGIVGIMMLVGAVLLGIGQDRLSNRISYFALVVSMTTVSLLVFYFDQFSTILSLLAQLVLLLFIAHYNRRYVRSVDTAKQRETLLRAREATQLRREQALRRQPG